MKILYVTTLIGTMSFFIDEIKHLQRCGHTVEVASNKTGNTRFNADELGVKVHHIPFSRSPIKLDNLRAYTRLRKIVKENRYDIVHCHTPNAAAIARMACRNIRKNGTRVIYTAHGFHFFKGAPIKNWIIYYPVEWLCAYWTDTLITINYEDYEFAKKKMRAQNIEYVPGVGIDLSKFSQSNVDVAAKRKELGIPEEAILLISVGELNVNKNHETVIHAIAGMDVYYVIAGKGKRAERLSQVAQEEGMGTHFKLLGYRQDVAALLAAADIFMFPSYREGLSVSLMETMASGKPAVVSRIRGNADLIDENGGSLFDPHSIEGCRKAIERVISADRECMGQYNKTKVRKYSTDVVIKKMDEVYHSA